MAEEVHRPEAGVERSAAEVACSTAAAEVAIEAELGGNLMKTMLVQAFSTAAAEVAIEAEVGGMKMQMVIRPRDRFRRLQPVV